MASMKPFYVLRLMKRDGDKCHYCGCEMDFRKDAENLPHMGTIDHKQPLSRGGTWDWSNLVLACLRCNNTKRNIPYTHFKWYLGMLRLGYAREEVYEMVEKSCRMMAARRKIAGKQ